MNLKEKDLDKVLWTMLNEMGVPNNLKGRGYIKDAIKIGLYEPDSTNHVIKEMYMPIAEWNEDKWYRVERCIRHAIEVSWIRGNLETIHKIFGYTTNEKKGRPTNAEFIAHLCNFVNTYGEDVLNGKYKF